MRVRTVAAFSFVLTALFFFEYIPPLRWVEIPYDLAEFHYSLDDYAFLSLKSGHFPEWDATIYCGMTFVGNPQTALFYPGMWLALLASAGRGQLSYLGLEIVVLAHVWLAFLFCFLWLRDKKLLDLAALFGAAVFAFSGYPLLQLQHFGLICGYAWFPLGLWSIDQSIATRNWRPLWKLACASALCFLAGYPPTFVVFCVCILTYAAFASRRWTIILWTLGALAFSLLLAMIQLLPALEALGQKVNTPQYGSGYRHAIQYISYLMPNYFDFSLTTPASTNPGGEYLYLGAPGIFGLLWLIFARQSLRNLSPILAVGLICFLLASNPFGLVYMALTVSGLLIQIVRAYYFLAGITLAAAALAAAGIDHFLRQEAKPVARWLVALSIACLAAWSALQIWIWLPGGPDFAAGWASAADALIALGLFSASIFVLRAVLRANQGRARSVLAAALILAVGVDYKAHGTSKRINAAAVNTDKFMAAAHFPGMQDTTFLEMQRHPEYRVALDALDLRAADLRHHSLTTPQGDDPLIPAQYFLDVIMPAQPQQPSQWRFLLDPANQSLLRALAVRYVIATEQSPFYARLKNDPDYRPLAPLDEYFRVFEYLHALPSYRWDGQAELNHWRPERRDFTVHAAAGGTFMLVEQLLPGWHAAIDGVEVTITRWNHAFQSIQVPAGNHNLSFTYRSPGLRLGAIISALSLLALAFLIRGSGTRVMSQ